MQNDPKEKKKPAAAKDSNKKNSDIKLKAVNVRHKIGLGGKKVIVFSVNTTNRFNRFTEREDTGDLKILGIRLRISFRDVAILSLVLLLIAYLLFTNTNIATQQIEVTVPGASSDYAGYRILHLSDLHGRDYGTSLARAISNVKFDLVLISGDMVGKSGNPQPFYDLIEAIGKRAPIYFVAGDSDPGPLLDSARPIEGTLNQMVLEDWILGAIDRGANYLNKPVMLEVGTSKLWLSPGTMLNVNADKALEMAEYELDLQKDGVLSGIDADYSVLPFTNYRYRQYKALKEAALYMEEDDMHIVLSHYPPNEQALGSVQWNVSNIENAYLATPDLAFCGHYCGGIWRVPVLGAFYIPDALAPRRGWLPNPSTVSGIRTAHSTTIHTSPGLGATDYGLFPDFRLFNSPKITLITLSTQLTTDLLVG